MYEILNFSLYRASCQRKSDFCFYTSYFYFKCIIQNIKTLKLTLQYKSYGLVNYLLFNFISFIPVLNYKLNFQHHYSSLQCHWFWRIISNMVVCYSRNISHYDQCWKQENSCVAWFCRNCVFNDWWIENSKRTTFLWNIYIFVIL